MKFSIIIITIIITLSCFVTIAVASDPQWHISTVDSNGDVGQYCSLKLDGSGNPHISYYNQTLTGNPKLQGDLKYAKWTGSEWEISTVDTGGVGLITTEYSKTLTAG